MVWNLTLALLLISPFNKAGQPKTVYEHLSNGTKVIAFVRSDIPYFVASLWVKWGSASDP